MKRWKLLKEMPGIPVGTILRLSNAGRLVSEKDSFVRISKSVEADKYPDFFEAVEDTLTHWRADYEARYFTVNNDSNIKDHLDTHEDFDERLYKVGNYFQTRAQATAVAEAIKALLQYIHQPLVGPDGTGCLPPRFVNGPDFINVANKARQAVQRPE